MVPAALEALTLLGTQQSQYRKARLLFPSNPLPLPSPSLDLLISITATLPLLQLLTR